MIKEYTQAKYDSDRLIPVLNLNSIEILMNYLKTLDVSSSPAFRGSNEHYSVMQQSLP
ncbi:hypothetical protein ABH968_005605 [Lysinibacillus sp. RC79]